MLVGLAQQALCVGGVEPTLLRGFDGMSHGAQVGHAPRRVLGITLSHPSKRARQRSTCQRFLELHELPLRNARVDAQPLANVDGFPQPIENSWVDFHERRECGGSSMAGSSVEGTLRVRGAGSVAVGARAALDSAWRRLAAALALASLALASLALASGALEHLEHLPQLLFGLTAEAHLLLGQLRLLLAHIMPEALGLLDRLAPLLDLVREGAPLGPAPRRGRLTQSFGRS